MSSYERGNRASRNEGEILRDIMWNIFPFIPRRPSQEDENEALIDAAEQLGDPTILKLRR